jgi:hypothetical protein
MTTKERAKLRNIVGRLQVILEDLEHCTKMAIISRAGDRCSRSVNSLGTAVHRLPSSTLPSPTDTANNRAVTQMLDFVMNGDFGALAALLDQPEPGGRFS